MKQVESLLKAAGVLPQNYVDETILEDDAEDDLDVDDDYEQDDEGYWEGSTWFEGNPEALRALKEGTTAHSDVIGVGKKKTSLIRILPTRHGTAGSVRFMDVVCLL